MSKLTSSNKPFDISKWLLMQAWEKVKANRGAPGVDGLGVDRFEEQLQDNLYKIWNRMSSGSYFHHRSVWCRFQNRMVAPGSWACQQWQIV